MQWIKKGSYQFDIKENKFSSGAFRDSFKARAISPDMQSNIWVVKQYQPLAKDTITDDLHMSLEDHTRNSALTIWGNFPDLCCFYGGGIRHNEDIMHSFQNFIVRLIPNHPPPLETRIWKLVVTALTRKAGANAHSSRQYY